MMKYRMHISAVVFGGLILYLAGDWLPEDALTLPWARSNDLADRMRQRIEERKTELVVTKQIRRAIEARSLPSNPDVARSLYRAWLLELVRHVGFSGSNVDSSEPVSRQGMYRTLSFSTRGRGTLAQLTKFLFEFYRADHLHQIRTLGITPLGSDQFDLSISIDAFALPTADRKDQLSSGTSDRLASNHLADYDVIVQRNLFGTGGSPDAANQTYLTSVIYVNDRSVAWFNLRMDGRILKLRKGDSLVQTTDGIRRLHRVGDLDAVQLSRAIGEIGTVSEIEDGDVIVESAGQHWLPAIGEDGESLEFFRFDGVLAEIGRVTEIEGTDVILEADGERWLLTIGENLAEAFALPPEF